MCKQKLPIGSTGLWRCCQFRTVSTVLSYFNHIVSETGFHVRDVTFEITGTVDNGQNCGSYKIDPFSQCPIVPSFGAVNQYRLTDQRRRTEPLLERPPVVQPLKTLPALFGTRKFITEATRRNIPEYAIVLYRVYRSPPLAPILSQSTAPPHYLSKIHFNIIHHLRLCLYSGLLPSGFPRQ
jgi:hypothetical protein